MIRTCDLSIATESDSTGVELEATVELLRGTVYAMDKASLFRCLDEDPVVRIGAGSVQLLFEIDLRVSPSEWGFGPVAAVVGEGDMFSWSWRLLWLTSFTRSTR